MSGRKQQPADAGAEEQLDQAQLPEREDSADSRGAERSCPDSADTRNWAADIADRARERNLGRAADLAAWVTTAEQGRLSADQRGEAAEIAHQLAGSAGTFGYLAATEIAREVEQLFADGDGRDCWARAGDCVRDLVRCLHDPPEVAQLE